MFKNIFCLFQCETNWIVTYYLDMTLNFCSFKIIFSNSSSFLVNLDTDSSDGEKSDSKSSKSQNHSPSPEEPLLDGLDKSSGKVLSQKNEF